MDYPNEADSLEYLRGAPLGIAIYNKGYKTMWAVRSATRLGLHYVLGKHHRKEERIQKFLEYRQRTLSSAFELNDRHWELIAYANSTPATLSLLYDMGRLPEQVINGSQDYSEMLNIIRHFKHHEEYVLKKASGAKSE